MSTGYGWEGLRQVCATLLGARHVPERLGGGLVYLGRYNKCSHLPVCHVRHARKPSNLCRVVQLIFWIETVSILRQFVALSLSCDSKLLILLQSVNV